MTIKREGDDATPTDRDGLTGAFTGATTSVEQAANRTAVDSDTNGVLDLIWAGAVGVSAGVGSGVSSAVNRIPQGRGGKTNGKHV